MPKIGFSEKKLVEDYIIGRLQERGWQFIPADELDRTSYDEPLLIPNLIKALKRINAHLNITDDELNKVVNELKLTPFGIEGMKRILNFYKSGIPVKLEKDHTVTRVQLFDFEDIKQNEFIITNQVWYQGRDKIRTDIILYVNGIPLVNIECKSPTDPSVSWYDAYKQIKDYENTVPELYKYVQIGVAAESVAKYFPIVPQQEMVDIHEWREELMDSIDSTIEMLSPDRLLDIIQNFLFFRIKLGSGTKVITRYMQYRAANKIVDRVINHLHGIDPKNKGLVWHWQGSGKTLTMIFAANKLFYMKELANPTIFFIVDRIELEDQLYKAFYSLDIVKPEIISSIEELKQVLSYDDYRGKRGIFITLIHKFRPDELRDLALELKEVSKNRETIMTRKNVIAFIDEGHRSQYGLLAAQMKTILKDAFFFALTGTPISKRGRDTYLEFSYPPDEWYLDKYFITDSIRDGFTVKIVYQPRLERVHLRKDLLETFLEVELEEIPEQLRDDVEEKIKQRLNETKLFLENPKRIDLVARDIAEHFKANVDGKFKAMVVAASRKACVLYKDALDKYLPPEYSEVVMTIGRDEPEPISSYVRETRARYGTMDLEDVRKDVIEKFREEEFPKILIVTDMLLTGFDAPILQVMYLDKPLKEHRLLQAIARTNRPYKDLKEAGIVIDYVGILKEFKRALEMYSTEDIHGALFSVDNIREEFKSLIHELVSIFDGLPRDYERSTLLKAVEILTTDEEKEQEFVENYRRLRKIFELLGPDEVKLEYFELYKWLSAIYTYYMKVVVQQPTLDSYVAKYYNKTVKYVHKAIEIDKLDRELPAITFDEDYLTKLEEKVKTTQERAANILFTLNRFVLVERHRNPVYESLVDRVEKLVQLWREKTKDYEQIYREGVKIINEIATLSKRQKQLNFTNLEYSMLLVLEHRLGHYDEFVPEIKKLSNRLKNYMLPGWISQPTLRKAVEREVRKFTRKLKIKHSLTLDEMNTLYEELIENVKNYGA